MSRVDTRQADVEPRAQEVAAVRQVQKSTSASIARSAGSAIFLLLAASAIALSKQADQPAANSCSGLVPMRAEPGADELDVEAAIGAAGEAVLPPAGGVGSWPCTRLFRTGARSAPIVLVFLRRRAPHWSPVASADSRAERRQPINLAATSMTAWAKACGASCGRLWPMPPVMSPVLVFARELLGVGAGLRMRRAVGIALERDGRHRDDRAFGEPLFQIVIFRLAFGEAEPPAVIVDHDVDVIRIVEGRRAAIERGVVEVPLRRGELPDELRELAPVFVVAGPAALGGEIELVPPFQLGLRRQRHLAGFLAADQIAAHRDQGLAALRPQRRDDVGGARAPIEAGEGRLLDLERIHQGR